MFPFFFISILRMNDHTLEENGGFPTSSQTSENRTSPNRGNVDV